MGYVGQIGSSRYVGTTRTQDGIKRAAKVPVKLPPPVKVPPPTQSNSAKK